MDTIELDAVKLDATELDTTDLDTIGFDTIRLDGFDLCRAEADDCLRRADSDINENDKPLWATLAQSWLQLAADRDRIIGDARAAALERAVEQALA